MLKSVLNCRRTAPSFLVFTALILRGYSIPVDVCNVTESEAGCNFALTSFKDV